jgi:hypothetical protein
VKIMPRRPLMEASDFTSRPMVEKAFSSTLR